MTDTELGYEPEQYPVTDEALARWTVRRSGREIVAIEGPCPRCGHPTEQRVEERIFTGGAGAAAAPVAPADRMTRLCGCACGQDHPGAKEATERTGCGSWWVVTIVRAEGLKASVRVAQDPNLLPALREAQEIGRTEAARIRSSAEKWIAGVSALLGLFGLTGVVVGKDAFTGLDAAARWVAGGATLLALGLAAAAVVCSYKAAYPFPVEVDIGNDQRLALWFAGRRRHLRKSVGNLRMGVALSLMSLAALVAAVACLWFWPRSAPSGSLVEMTLADDSRVCGELLDSRADRELRVRRADGTVRTVDAAALVRLGNSASCPA
ncbi:hypothetical protein ACIA8O_15565 [Kitasatospora sp. NPDC051853]|uniref:hypothetical protein n=1 Tax=Kitasatospora sp. NPDC051853 TaxID=3364058 RepID=UPI0037AFA032